MSHKIKISQAADLVTIALKAGLAPMIHGSPAIGKSAIVHQIAKAHGLKLIDLRLSQCDPSDLLGFPQIKDGKASYVPMDTFPLEGDPIPAGYNGWLLFLDEATSAPRSVQAPAYKLILDRMVGLHHLHNNVAIVAAGNLDSDGAIVEPMSTALQSRLLHLEVEVSVKDWIKWANEKQFDHRITSFIEYRNDKLYTFSPDHTDKTYASPRTWEFAHRLLGVANLEHETLPLLIGTLGEGVAREFFGFCRLQEKLPTVEQIMRDPEGTPVPGEPSTQYALVGSIASHAKEDNLETLLKYIKRLPAEFQVTCVRSMCMRNKSLIKIPAITEWIVKSSAELM